MMTGSPPFTQGNPHYCGDADLNWLNEALDDDGLDLSDSIRATVSEITRILHQRGRTPTPALVTKALQRLGYAPPEDGPLTRLLMMNWKRTLDEVDALDPEALQTHLRQAPIREHPLCYYVAGMIHALTFTRWWFGRTGVGQPGGPPLRSDRHPLVTAGQPANGNARFTKE